MSNDEVAPIGAGSGAPTSSSSSSSMSINFEKLNGISNYGDWKFMMRMYLVHEDLWDCIEESSPGKPIVTDARQQDKTLALICLMVQPSSFCHVRNACTGYAAWNNLKIAYEDRGLCKRIGLVRTLIGLKLEQFSSMEAYLMKISELDQQLRDIDSPLEDDFLSGLILSGLPSDYTPFIMALEVSNIQLSSKIVKFKLLQEYLRRDLVRCKQSASSINHVKKGGEKQSTRVMCFNCRKFGHFARNCTVKLHRDDTFS